jgi:hypothetical protein
MKSKHKRLSTFRRTGRVLEDDGITPRDLTGYTPRATMAFRNGARTNLTITLIEETGEYTVTASPEEQVTWPLGEAHWDAVFYNEVEGDAIYTQTHRVEIERQIAELPETPL